MFLETSIWSWILPIALGLGLGIVLATRKNHDYTKIIVLNAEDFRLNMRKGQLIDIRSEAEFAIKRINGSRNFPKKTIYQNIFRLRVDQPIFLYDKTQSKMLKAVSRKLVRKGFHPVYVLAGGLEKWQFSVKEF
ncbi:MAG: rhodanese-like domain-containing protein [Candidatus Izemoplasmatales bacterium]|nr:rhodanese-like domain-containing protein [Candidatus Izemoplasmatales bacterium]